MNQGALDRTTFEAIEAYVLDRMPAAERAAFEQRLAGDPDLRAEVQLERENIRAVELGGVQRLLKEIAAGEGAVDRSRRSGAGWLTYAAAAVLLLVAATWWATRPSAGERAFAAHFLPDPGLPVVMGIAHDPAFNEAMTSYKEGDYAGAKKAWSAEIASDPHNDTLHYYIGMAALAQGDAREAIDRLLPLMEGPDRAFHDRAGWYLFLAYVRAGEQAKARAVDLSADRTHAEEAERILEELDR